MSNLSINAVVFALFCVLSLMNSTHAVAQTPSQFQQSELPEAPKKKSDRTDFFYKASFGYLAAGTTVDALTTAQGLSHPTLALRADQTPLTHYYVTEDGWARCFGNRNEFAAVSANLALNVGVAWLSRELYHRGGKWRTIAIGLNVFKGTSSMVAGIRNARNDADIDRRVRLATGYNGMILWSR